jgi:hypothetical protein
MDPPEPEPQPRPVQEQRRKKELTRDQRTQIVSRLLFELQHHGADGNFARGTLTAVAIEFHVCEKTIRNVWKRACPEFSGSGHSAISSKSQKTQLWSSPKVEP